MNERMLFDLGWAFARLEPADDNQPMLTIVTPATEGEAASSLIISGWDNLIGLATGILKYAAEHDPAARLRQPELPYGDENG